jgi:hypothetical protein
MAAMKKHWGPFNGRQLTTIIVALIIGIVVIPAGAWAAVSFTNVAITDPGGVNRAKVDAGGSVHVGDGTGPLSVDGTVTARPTSLSALVHGANSATSASSCVPVLTAPAGKALIVTVAHVDIYDNPTPGFGNYVALYVGSGPTNCADLVTIVNTPGVQTTALPFEAGLAIPAGKSLNMAVGGGVSAQAFAFGYTVSPSSVPATTAAPARAPQG